MAVIWRRGRGSAERDPEQAIRRAREVETGLRTVLENLRAHLDELEDEVYRPQAAEEA
jgi:hypothetical protein